MDPKSLNSESGGVASQLAHTGSHTHSRHSKRDWLDYQGWPGEVTGSDQGKRLVIGRVVASGSPEARKKGLDDQVEWSPPEALRPAGKV